MRMVSFIIYSIIDREKQLSLLYQKQGRATQFSSKADRDEWLQKEIDDLERVLSTNTVQVICFFEYLLMLGSHVLECFFFCH